MSIVYTLTFVLSCLWQRPGANRGGHLASWWWNLLRTACSFGGILNTESVLCSEQGRLFHAGGKINSSKWSTDAGSVQANVSISAWSVGSATDWKLGDQLQSIDPSWPARGRAQSAALVDNTHCAAAPPPALLVLLVGNLLRNTSPGNTTRYRL